jgi:hypothetical protein
MRTGLKGRLYKNDLGRSPLAPEMQGEAPDMPLSS